VDTIPLASGIYQIRCVPTGKIYVGSAVNLRKRWQQHKSRLRIGKHVNRYLQAAWDKYGQEQFAFAVLEFIDVTYLLQAEQEWMVSTCCTDRTIGFNISDTAGSPGGVTRLIWEGFIDPLGKETTIVGLQDFCDRHQLDYRSMHRLYVGKSKLKSYRGWTHKNSIRQRDYVKTHQGFIDPQGRQVEPITNLAEFCRHHGLDDTHMLAVARGRICSHRGWTHIDSRRRQNTKTYYNYVNPEGNRVTITNLSEFCRQNNLHPVKMHHLKSGKITQYKGWTWRKEDTHGQ
jgi:group I intron endonuclease